MWLRRWFTRTTQWDVDVQALPRPVTPPRQTAGSLVQWHLAERGSQPITSTSISIGQLDFRGTHVPRDANVMHSQTAIQTARTIDRDDLTTDPRNIRHMTYFEKNVINLNLGCQFINRKSLRHFFMRTLGIVGGEERKREIARLGWERRGNHLNSLV